MSSSESATTALATRLQRSLSLSERSSLRPPQRTFVRPLDASAAQTLEPLPLQKTFSWPLDASAAQITRMPIFKLASFEPCSCDRFDGGQAHLSVHTRTTKLHETEGVAISYAWAAFDREERCIGHERDSPADTVYMELGSEWRVSSVQEHLAQLTEQHDGCWVDQICMAPKRRKTLVAIPAIFSTLHVTVLLPGSLCGCLRKSFDEYQAAKVEVDEQEASADQSSEASARLYTCMKRLARCLEGTDCLNSNGACSWTKRMWTSQEFVYSKSCSFLFANQEVMECCKIENSNYPVVKPEQLNDYSRRLYEDLVKRHSLPRNVVHFLRRENTATSKGLMYMLAAVMMTPTDGLQQAEQASLLLGDRQVWDITGRGHWWRLSRDFLPPFITTLEAIKNESRIATQAADYILSVFPAMDGYVVPGNFNDLSPAQLLENALAQLFKLHNLFIPNLSPVGLSGSTSICRSAQWSPDISRAATEIRDSTDIYGSFLWLDMIHVRSPARLPLRLPSIRTINSLGQNAQDFDTWVGGLDIWKAIAHFAEMLIRWSSKWLICAERLQQHFSMSFADGSAKLYSSSESELVTGLMWLVS